MSAGGDLSDVELQRARITVGLRPASRGQEFGAQPAQLRLHLAQIHPRPQKPIGRLAHWDTEHHRAQELELLQIDPALAG